MVDTDILHKNNLSVWGIVFSTSTQEVLDHINRTRENLFYIINNFDVFRTTSWYRLQSFSQTG